MDSIKPGTSTDKTSKPSKYHKMTVNQIAYAALIQEGVSPGEASRQLGLSDSYGCMTDKRFNKMEIDPGSIIAQAAVKRVEKLAKGKTFGTIDKVKDSTALAANEVFIDRAWPKKTVTVTTNINLVGAIKELAEFQGSPGTPIDVTPTTTHSGVLPGTTTGRGGEEGRGED